MIADTDTLTLAPGVAFDRGQLADAIRGGNWPLNGSGAFVLARTGRPVGQIVRETAEAFSIPSETARDDVLRFAWHLNALALVNVERGGSRLRRLTDWVLLAARLVPAGTWPGALARRRALDTRSVRRAVASSLTAILSRVVVVAAVSTVVAVQLSAVVGVLELAVPLALGLGTGGGLGVHEAAHAASLRGVPSALVMHGRRTYILHAKIDSRRRSVVALAGPLTVAALGVAVVLGGVALAAPSVALGGCPLAAHALALTVVGGDGRVVCGV
jgi:hypothetical protein